MSDIKLFHIAKTKQIHFFFLKKILYNAINIFYFWINKLGKPLEEAQIAGLFSFK